MHSLSRRRTDAARRSAEAWSPIGLLHHQLWLRDLERLGLEMRSGARGQMHVGGGAEPQTPVPHVS